MSNMKIWDSLKKPPDWALKPIKAGRLKGKTDINPQWRYEAMTQQFGPCGEGWKYSIDKLWKEDANGNCILAFAQITLYIKNGDKWGEGIPGIGGNQMVQLEKAGPHANDECYKMAVTDALSVACKMIGVGAEIYKGLSDSKYNAPPSQPNNNDEKPWLNKGMPAYAKAKQQIADGEITIKDVRKVYKVSTAMAAMLEAKPTPNEYDQSELEPQPDDLPFGE